MHSHSLDEFAAGKLRELDSCHRRRTLQDSARTDGIWIERGGRRLLSFSCNDYLNLSQHPRCARPRSPRSATMAPAPAPRASSPAIIRSIASWKRGWPQFKGSEAACVFGSGYLANIGIIPALIGAGDLILVDELAHACIWAGARLERRDRDYLPA